MNCLSHRFFLLTFFVCVASQVALADRITMIEGKGRPVTGTIVGIASDKVTIDVSGKTQEIPANQIEATIFEKEPSGLANARTAVIGSRMTEVLTSLEKVDPKELSNYMKQDYDYFLATAKGRLALSDAGNFADAEKELTAFVKNNKASYHFYEICELYGDVMVAQNKFSDAKNSYEVLIKAPWPEYTLKAQFFLGMAEVRDKKIDAARKNFDAVIAAPDDSEQAQRFKNMAKVGLAICLSEEKKFDESIAALENIAKNSESDDSLFQSLVYNALGSVYNAAGKPREAILAYMHTDILFSSSRREHIQALKELVKLWNTAKRADRSKETEERLKELYNISAQ
ncbi:MAG: tetratricopeptide repeat protein [Thermoguttaceae bacterium]